jgi:hypothetical protein
MLTGRQKEKRFVRLRVNLHNNQPGGSALSDPQISAPFNLFFALLDGIPAGIPPSFLLFVLLLLMLSHATLASSIA